MKWIGEILTECPSCGSSKTRHSGVRKDSAEVFECVDCGLGFLNPMPYPNEITEFYKGYYDRNDGFGYESYRDIGEFYWLDYYLLARLNDSGIRPGSKILDIGCASGNEVYFLNKKGFQAKGFDISEDATTHGRKKYGLDLIKSSIEEYSAQEQFDAIIMLDLIEHIRNPKIWTGKVSELLKPGAVVAMATPNFSLHRKVGDEWTGFQRSFEHLYFFSPDSLKSLLKHVGIKVEFESSLKGMPIRSNSREDAQEESHRYDWLKMFDDISGHKIRRLYGAWQKSRGRNLYEQFAGEVTENHLLFVLGRKV